MIGARRFAPPPTMSPDFLASARALWQHRVDGSTLAALPEAGRPRTAAEGMAIQTAWAEHAGQPVAGWKIAATSTAGQAHIHVSGPLPGRILRSFVHAQGEVVPLRGNRMRVVEPEYAFRLATDLPPQAAHRSLDEVMAAVASLHPSFEVPDSRFSDFTQAGEAQLLADDACCGRFLFGPAAPEGWRTLDLASHRVQATVTAADGRLRLQRDGEGRAVLGDPRLALHWLANALSGFGLGLRAGDYASVGTCMVPLAIEPGDRVQADYGVLGRLAIELGRDG